MRGNYNFKSFNGVEARKGAVEFFYSYEAEELLQKAFHVFCKTSILFWMKTYLEAPKEYKQEFLKSRIINRIYHEKQRRDREQLAAPVHGCSHRGIWQIHHPG